MKNARRLITLATLFAAATSQAQCLSDVQVEDFVGSYFAKTPAVNPPASSEEDGFLEMKTIAIYSISAE